MAEMAAQQSAPPQAFSQQAQAKGEEQGLHEQQQLPHLTKEQLHSQSEGAVSSEVLRNISELAAAHREKYRRTGSLQEKAAHQRDVSDPLPHQSVLSRNRVLGQVLSDVNEAVRGFIWPQRELAMKGSLQKAVEHSSPRPSMGECPWQGNVLRRKCGKVCHPAGMHSLFRCFALA